jgi:phospholipid/cholesterol/gamma-HCH transport system substrate-binding protein
MAKLSAEAKVGLLVIVGSVVLVFMTFAVGKYQFGEKKGYILEAVFDSVAGLDTQASVRMAGVKIGIVETVELDDSRAKVILRINPDVHIQRGTEAMIKTMGLLGEKYVEFVPGKTTQLRKMPPEASAYYGKGERVQATISPSDVDKLVNQLSSISDDIKQVTASLSQVFGSERGTRSMEDILHDLRETMANIKDFSSTLQTDGSELVVRINELVAKLDGVVGENRDNLKVTMENIKEASKSAELALASLENTSRKIERGEGTIGKLVNDESMYNNIDSAAKGISDYTSRVERLKTTVGFRSEYMFPKFKNYFSLELKPRMDQYYIIELVSDPFGRYTRTETITTPPGNTVVSETYEDKLKFSIEFVKRYGNLAFRMGLIESTGGVGGDYYAFDDRFKFSLDAFDSNSHQVHSTRTHMKATASYMLNKVLFINGGYDNFLNTERDAFFIGAGLRFTDDDLKYYMGSVPMPR